MSTRDLIRRAAFALLAAVACQNALAQSGLRVRNIRVDVAPLRANVGEPTASWVQQALPEQLAQALAGRMTAQGGALVVRIDYLTLGPIKDSSARDNISGVAMIGNRAMAGAGDDKISGFGDRPDVGRAIQSPTCGPTRASAYVLAGQRPLNTAHGRRFIAPVAFSVKPVLNGSTSRDQYRWSRLCRVRTNPEALCRRAGPGGSAILALFRCLTG